MSDKIQIQANGNGPGRKLKFNILRYNPQLKGDKPRMVTYEVEEAAGRHQRCYADEALASGRWA